MKAQFIGTCVGLPEASLHEYDDTEKEVGYRTFLRHVGGGEVRELNRVFGVAIGKDWAVSFGKGVYEGRPAVCMHHSGIHHLYALPA